MARSFRKLEILVEIQVAEGSFNSNHDLMEYVRYRLGMHSRDSDNVKMGSIYILKESDVQMEIKL